MPMPDGLMDLMETTKAFDQITDQALTAPETTEQVTLTALANAASVAGLLLTTEAMIAEKPDDDQG